MQWKVQQALREEVEGGKVVSRSKKRPPAAFSRTTSFSLLGTCQLVSVKGPVRPVCCNYWYELAAAKAFENLAETWLLRNSTLWHVVFTPLLSSSPVAWTRTGRMLFIIFYVVLFVFHRESGTLDKIDTWWQTGAWLENFWWLFSAWKGNAVLHCHSAATHNATGGAGIKQSVWGTKEMIAYEQH